MTALLIIGAILLILALLVCCHVRIKIDFADEFTVKLHYLFLRFTLIPAKENSDKKKKSKKPKNKKKPKKSGDEIQKEVKEKVKKKGIAATFSEYKSLFVPILKDLGKFIHKIKINPLKVRIVEAGKDAAELAIDYGKLCAVFYPALAVACEQMKIGRKVIYLGVDYSKSESVIEIHANVKIRIISALAFGLKALYKLVRTKVKSLMKNNSGSAQIKNVSSRNNSNERNAVK